MDRREALLAVAALATIPSTSTEVVAQNYSVKRTTIALLVYPDFTALDLVGPHHVFSMLDGFDVQLVWKTTDMVTSDLGLAVKPTMTFKDCPEELAAIFVPGGTAGTVSIMSDPEVIGFLKSRGDKADYVTSVCTGSLVLGAAGLLRGYKATSHWVAIDILKLMGVEPVEDRVVWDRNRVTGGGVTAGIDFALSLAARLRDDEYAKSIQLIMEYAPSPPFRAGTPQEAGATITDQMREMFAPFVNSAIAAARKTRATW